MKYEILLTLESNEWQRVIVYLDDIQLLTTRVVHCRCEQVTSPNFHDLTGTIAI